MYLYSQDKSRIVGFGGGALSRLEIQKNLAGKKEQRVAIVAARASDFSSQIILGFYTDENAARAELGRIMAALRAGETCYDMN